MHCELLIGLRRFAYKSHTGKLVLSACSSSEQSKPDCGSSAGGVRIFFSVMLSNYTFRACLEPVLIQVIWPFHVWQQTKNASVLVLPFHLHSQSPFLFFLKFVVAINAKDRHLVSYLWEGTCFLYMTPAMAESVPTPLSKGGSWHS